MADQPSRPTRAERLAAQLRENLKRRKAQSRAQAKGAPGEPAVPAPEPLPKSPTAR